MMQPGRIVWTCAALALAACGLDVAGRRDGGRPPDSDPPPAITRDPDAGGSPTPARPGADASARDARTCGVGETDCGGSCADLSRDPTSCGACGHACAPNEQCAGGVCVCACSSPGVCCEGGCVYPDRDPGNCGVCGHACRSEQLCVAGACVCDEWLDDCDGRCVDLQTDNASCGACGHACEPGGACLGGHCEYCFCLGTCCDTGCADLQNDPGNCGGCGVTVPPRMICQNGMPTCPPGTLPCDGTCVPVNDPNNCGRCGNVCRGACPLCQYDMGTGTASCFGECWGLQLMCGAGPGSCGECVDPYSDPDNCGACGVRCTGGSSCVGGHCTCGALVDCDGGDGFDCRDPASAPCPP